MDIVCNNGVLKVRHQSGLPLGYTQVEYLTNDAYSWIETDISVLDNDEVDFYWRVDRNGSIFAFSQGASSDGEAYQLANATSASTPGVVFDIENYNPYRVLTGFSANTPSINHIQIVGKEIFINSTSYGTSQGTLTSTDVKLRLFVSSTGTVSISYMGRFTVKGKIDLIPCIRDSDNELGFYDTVSGQFFTNAGTGDFAAGSAVSDPVVAYADGTVETIEDTIGNTATAEMLLSI